jgi:hypothetical protein
VWRSKTSTNFLAEKSQHAVNRPEVVHVDKPPGLHDLKLASSQAMLKGRGVLSSLQWLQVHRLTVCIPNTSRAQWSRLAHDGQPANLPLLMNIAQLLSSNVS